MCVQELGGMSQYEFYMRNYLKHMGQYHSFTKLLNIYQEEVTTTIISLQYVIFIHFWLVMVALMPYLIWGIVSVHIFNNHFAKHIHMKL